MSNKDKISVSEFKSWLSGVLDFQTDDWTPDKTQWEKILAKIEQLDDTSSIPPQHKPEVAPSHQEPDPYRHRPILRHRLD